MDTYMYVYMYGYIYIYMYVYYVHIYIYMYIMHMWGYINADAAAADCGGRSCACDVICIHMCCEEARRVPLVDDFPLSLLLTGASARPLL